MSFVHAKLPDISKVPWLLDFPFSFFQIFFLSFLILLVIETLYYNLTTVRDFIICQCTHRQIWFLPWHTRNLFVKKEICSTQYVGPNKQIITPTKNFLQQWNVARQILYTFRTMLAIDFQRLLTLNFSGQQSQHIYFWFIAFSFTILYVHFENMRPV